MAKELPGKVFRLKWDNHLQNLSCLFDNLYVQQKYVDVTLCCDGGSLRAHKVVLSSCSAYFETIFKDHPCKHPVVIMNDVKAREMQMLLEYMYKGELNVQEEELNSFVGVASLLNVRGLSDNLPKSMSDAAVNPEEVAEEGQYPYEEPPEGSHINPLTGMPFGEGLSMREVSPDRQSTPLSFTDVLQDMLGRQSSLDSSPVREGKDSQKQRRSESGGPDVKRNRVTVKEEYIPPASPLEILEITENRLEGAREDGVEERTECSICKLNFLTPSLLQTHLQDEHNYTEDYRPHRCDFCPLAFYRSAHLKRHRRLHTGEKPFTCELCGKSFSRQDKLKQHVQRHGPHLSPLAMGNRGRGGMRGKAQQPIGRGRPAFTGPRMNGPFGDVSYLSSMSVAPQRPDGHSAEQLLRSVQDLGECIIQPCPPPRH